MRMLFLLPVLVFMLTGPSPAAQRRQPFASAAGPDVSVQLPDRRLDVSAPVITPTMTAGVVQASVTVTVTNTGPQAFGVQPDDFTLSAEGDMFGQGGAPGATGTLTGTVGPGVSRAGQLRFVVPRAALPALTLLYHPLGLGLVASIPLGGAGTTPGGSACGADPAFRGRVRRKVPAPYGEHRGRPADSLYRGTVLAAARGEEARAHPATVA
jgi:hypothetical protein